MAIAVLVTALALGAVAVLSLLLLYNALTAATDSVLATKSHDVAALVSAQDVGEAGQAITSGTRPDVLVQIVDSAGHVVHASQPALLAEPMSGLRPAPGASAVQEMPGGTVPALEDGYRVQAVGVDSGSQRYWVLVAQSLQVRTETLGTVSLFLLLAGPALLLLVGASVRILVGRSLRQLERIRAQVEQVAPGSLSGRVTVPHTRDELEALARTMNAMLERVESADRMQRRFLSDAGHELRSPLATLQTGLEVAAGDAGGSHWPELGPMLAGEARRMAALVEDLLTLSRGQHHALVPEVRDVDLDDVVSSELARARAAGTRRIESVVEPARVRGDARRLTQVVRNVLDNAERHAASTVWVALATQGKEAVLTVDNDGPPVPERERERIFERFVRLDDSRSRDTGGSGLGLAIARTILAAHGGSVSAEEGPCGRCRFRIALPLP